MCNLDWLQPYKNSQYSLGVIYLSILNLPRAVRNLRHNVIMVATLPHTHHAHTEVVPRQIEPMVDQLLELYNGVSIKGVSTVIKACLLGVTADLPASRAITGMMSYNATNGCTKCHKASIAPGSGKRKAAGSHPAHKWGGFADDFAADGTRKRKTRTHQEALDMSQEYLQGKSKADRDKTAKASGVRWSPLLNLPYFDIVRCTVIDMMHNRYLGVAKKILKLWFREGIVDIKLEQAVQRLDVPGHLGKIMSSFYGSNFKKRNETKKAKLKYMKAAELLHFVIYYSDVVLEDLIDAGNFSMWKCFSASCRLSSGNYLTADNIKECRKQTRDCLIKCEDLHGQECVPNMHLMMEGTLEQLEDWGPDHVVWCFAMERLNGAVGNISVNGKQIAGTIMDTFMGTRELNVQDLSGACTAANTEEQEKWDKWMQQISQTLTHQ